MVKKIVFLCMLGLLLAAVSIPAQNKVDVKLKFNKQDGLTRIVFEAEETFIQRIKVNISTAQVKLDFPEAFNLMSQKELPFEMAPTDRSLVIKIPDESDMKFFRLTAPSRLVLDIRKKETATGKQPGKNVETPTEKPVVKQPEKPSDKQPGMIIAKSFAIDAGHGGYDFGITNGNVNEKDISLILAKDLGAALAKKGKKVILLRKVDQYLPLMERINLVNQKSPDVFISLHVSLSRNFVLYNPRVDEQTANDTVALYRLNMKQNKYAGKSKALSDGIEKALKEEFRGDVFRREIPLPLLNSVGAPAVIIEIPSPGFVVYDQQMRTRLVNALMQGITFYGQ
jgi:N-acetylmuramoyl-L-alanine amidase